MIEAAALVLVTTSGGPLPVETTIVIPPAVDAIDDAAWQIVATAPPDAPPIPTQSLATGPWASDGPVLCFIMPPSPDGGEREMALTAATPREPAFRFEETDDRFLHLYDDGQQALTYNFGMILPDGVPEDRRRSSYIHPIFGLDGEQVTGDFPKDHYHHRGLFWTWPKVTVEGQTYDLWAIRGIRTRFERWLGREAGPVCAVFGVQNGWYVGDRRVMGEQVWFRVWRAGEVGRAIDAHLTFEADGAPVTLLGATGKGYGGFCLRVPVVEGKTVTKSDGETTTSSNEEKLPWADMSAKFAGDDRVSGASVFIDSDNLGFPNGWCLREYGFLGVDWPGLEPFTLEPGRPVTAKYRVWIHRGDVEAGHVAAAYESFAHPPRVTVDE